MTVVSCNQPAYLPWMGYFDRIAKSDVHVVLDHVQFEKGSYTNRCRIKQRDGREMWLTIPVEKGKPINRTRVSGQAWVRKHREALSQAYGAPWEEWTGDFFSICATASHLLSDVIRYTGLPLRDDDADRLYSSDLGGASLGTKSELVLNLCKEVGATTYLSGPHGRNYLDLPSFDKAGIEVAYHDFPTDGDWGLSAVHHLFGESTCKPPSLSKSADTTKPTETTTGQSQAA